ncbi:VOC family protein [Chitinophaga sp. Hz27]|uniref:VOC family protein n=1 Tax=Chitinophaga sp. Hz27 TaxID=3347169 RepID=UPI0035D82D6E
MKLKLSTIILYVQNPARLKAFYKDVLALEVIEEDDIWIRLKAGDAYIGLHQIGNQYLCKIASGHQFDNNTKIVFELEEDINIVREKLLALQVPMRDIKTFPNYDYWLCDGTDPEGNVFQLKQRK